MANRVRVQIQWVDAEIFESQDVAPHLQGFHAILVPGGFGERGTEGKIKAAEFARQHNVPYLGICLGMQMAVIEAARNVVGLKAAGSEEFDHEAGKRRFEPVVYHLKEWVQGNHKVARSVSDDKGGTMRLGAYDAALLENSKVADIYGTQTIDERHRHRYEVDIKYRDQLEAAGLRFSGMSPDGRLPDDHHRAVCVTAPKTYAAGVIRLAGKPVVSAAARCRSASLSMEKSSIRS